MTDLRVGHDYHLAEAKPYRDRAGKLTAWVAHCDACGWFGMERDTKSAADDDAAAHDRTENE
jgi:hypothetical protein